MKQYFAIIFLVLMFLNLAGSAQSSAQAYPTIVEDYPLLPACENNVDCRPGGAGFGLPEFIKYIFIFALGIVGIVGLLAIIISAFGYVTSVGNPQKAAESKDRITSALLGILLLLGSWVLLNIINPDLLKLGEPTEAIAIDIEVEPGVTEEECHYGTANLKPAPLDFAGGQYKQTLTITKVNCTADETKQNKVFIDLRQHQPGGNDATYSDVISNSKLIKSTDTEYVLEWTYVVILNLLKNKPEQFYLTGEIKIPNKPSQNIPKINFTIIDGG